MPRVIENLLYDDLISGELAGSVTAVKCPDRKCNAVQFHAVASNTGNVYIGGAGVTIPDGVTDTTTGIELAPGTPMQFIPCSNLDMFYYICDNATDDLVYLALI
jgi:hypothetical protein